MVYYIRCSISPTGKRQRLVDIFLFTGPCLRAILQDHIAPNNTAPLRFFYSVHTHRTHGSNTRSQPTVLPPLAMHHYDKVKICQDMQQPVLKKMFLMLLISRHRIM